MRGLDIQFMIDSIPEIVRGVPNAILIAVFALIAGGLIGLLCALVRIFKVPVLRQIVAVYIAVIRGTPLMVQILVVYYGIPRLLEYLNYMWVFLLCSLLWFVYDRNVSKLYFFRGSGTAGGLLYRRHDNSPGNASGHPAPGFFNGASEYRK